MNTFTMGFSVGNTDCGAGDFLRASDHRVDAMSAEVNDLVPVKTDNALARLTFDDAVSIVEKAHSKKRCYRLPPVPCIRRTPSTAGTSNRSSQSLTRCISAGTKR